MKYLLLFTLVGLLTTKAFSQSVGINTGSPDSSAVLDVQSTSKGMLVPRLTKFQRLTIPNPAEGLLVFDTDSDAFWYFQDGWKKISDNSKNVWMREHSLSPAEVGDTSIYFMGKIAIGKDSSDYPLEIYSGGLTSMKITNEHLESNINSNSTNVLQLESSGSGSQNEAGLAIEMNGSSGVQQAIQIEVTGGDSLNYQQFGTIADISGNALSSDSSLHNNHGSLVGLTGYLNTYQAGYRSILQGTSYGRQRGTLNEMHISGDGEHIGTYNYFNSIPAAGDHIGVKNRMRGSGVLYGTYQEIGPFADSTIYGMYNDMNGGSNDDDHYGIYQNFDYNSANGNHYGMYNQFAQGSSNGDHYGFYNYFTGDFNSGAQYGAVHHLAGTGLGAQLGTKNILQNSSDATQTATWNEITSDGIGSHIGTLNGLNGKGSGTHHGTQNIILGTGIGNQYGINTLVANTGPGEHYGAYQYLTGPGAGIQIGSAQEIDNEGDATHVGVSNTISGIGTGSHYGMNNILIGTGSGNQYGTRNYISNGGPGIKTGTENALVNNSDATQYGINNLVSSHGNGDYYGSRNIVNGSGDGLRVAGYFEASGTGVVDKYAAIFNSGHVVANESGGEYDFRIESKNEEHLFFVDANEDFVGIGTDKPLTILDVRGTEQIKLNSSASNPHLLLIEDENDFARIAFQNTDGATYWSLSGRPRADNDLSRFNIYNSEQGNILSVHGDGDVIIDERLGVNIVNSEPAAAIQANSNAGSDALRIQVDNVTKMRVYDDGHISLGGNYNDGTPNDVFITNQLGMGVPSPVYRIDIQNSTTASLGKGRANEWLSLSDARVKKKVSSIDYGLKEVLQLRPVKYNHHSSQFTNDGLDVMSEHSPEIGFLAQEVYQVIEEIVEKPIDDSKDLWSMNYEKLTPVLVKAIQEQNEMIQALKYDNARLSTKLSDQSASFDERITQLEKLLHGSAQRPVGGE